MSTKVLFEQKYCFVESFDSVRYTKLSENQRFEELQDTEKKMRQAQVEIELIYALLLGLKIVVPEAHSFDSIGFLEIIPKALDARKNLPQGSLKHDWIREPFVLALIRRDNCTKYLDMVSLRLKQSGFTLSALPEISENIKIRQEISKLILESSFKEIENIIHNELPQQEYVNCVNKIDGIRKINDYFSGLKQPREARNLGNRLEEYVRNLISLNNIPEIYQTEEGFNQIRNGLMLLDRAGIKFYDRSTVRNRGKEYLDMEDYFGVVEYVDSCYNAVIYQATGADTGFLTTTETTRGRYVLLAQRLSEESANLGLKDRIKIKFNDKEAQIFKKYLESWHGKRGDRWQGLWEIMLNDRWINSVNEFIQSPDETKRVAYKTHLKNLQKLTDEYSSDISIGETKEFSQSLHAVADRKHLVTIEQCFEESEEEEDFEEDGTCVDGSTPGIDL